MYQFSYSEILANSSAGARANEWRALDQAVEMLTAAAAAQDPQGPLAEQALSFVTQLWGVFIHDLADPHNDHTPEFRASLISVGLWVMNEAQAIGNGASVNFAGIADICVIVRDGLR